MDNIQKLVLGVLGVAGLLAFLTPTQIETPEPVSVPVAEIPQPTGEEPIVEEIQPEFEEPEDENFVFGQPTIDGKPIIDEEFGSPITDSSDQSVQPGQGDLQQSAPPNFLPQQAPMPQLANGQPTVQSGEKEAPVIAEPM